MKVLWEERAWADYIYWQRQDRKTLKRINELVKTAAHNLCGCFVVGEASCFSGNLLFGFAAECRWAARD